MNDSERIIAHPYQEGLGDYGDGPDEEAPILPYFLTQEEVMDLDFASLPAALCWASYSTNNWAMDLAARAVSPAAWMGEEQRKKGNADDLPKALLIAECCRPLEAKDIGIDPAKLGGTLSRGIWSHGRISRAIVCVESRPDASKALHFCVRGTDFDNHPNRLIALIQGTIGYFVWTYLRIEKHAFGFEPLAKALSQYASTSMNGISEVVLSGHSLGGATVQSLMPSFADCSVEVSLVTFGSPGSGSGWLQPISYFNRWARKGLRIGLRALSRLTHRLPSLSHALEMSSNFFVNPLPKKMGKRKHFKHPNDPIAKYSALIYRKTGNEIVALSSLEIPTDGGDMLNLKVSGIGAHACSRYFQRINDMLRRSLEDVAPYAEPTLALTRLRAARAKELELENEAIPEQMNERVKIARHGNRQHLKGLPNSAEAITRMDRLPEPRATAIAIREGRKWRKIVANMTING